MTRENYYGAHNDYGNYETAWCPGCGNFSILEAIKKALAASSLEPRDVLLVSGIGQAAKTPHYLNSNIFNGLHGRALPVATGAKLANTQLTVLVTSGDGCSYGEGGNHLLATIRRNINITLLVHNNQIYGLTKGQASPTSPEGFITKAQPQGTPSGAFNPIAVAIALKAGFVARGFSGRIDHLSYLIEQGIAHKGFSLIDILQPCVSFNKINTFAWYDSRCYNLSREYDPADWDTAIKTGHEWGDKIPLGIIYKNNRPSFESHFPILKQGPLYRQTTNKRLVNGIMDGYR